MKDLKFLEEAIGYRFMDQTLLAKALTHASTDVRENYERLEFLGDRVLGLSVSTWLYDTFPLESEGDLAKRLAALVQGPFLAQLAITLHLGNYVRFSASELASGGAHNAHILADVFESVLGALYLDGGFVPCDRLVRACIGDAIHAMKTPPQHPKTTLQEWAQGAGLPLPIYEIAEQSGPDHAPSFVVHLHVQGYDTIHAKGSTRQAAEKAAAVAFLEKYAPQIYIINKNS